MKNLSNIVISRQRISINKEFYRCTLCNEVKPYYEYRPHNDGWTDINGVKHDVFCSDCASIRTALGRYFVITDGYNRIYLGNPRHPRTPEYYDKINEILIDKGFEPIPYPKTDAEMRSFKAYRGTTAKETHKIMCSMVDTDDLEYILSRKSSNGSSKVSNLCFNYLEIPDDSDHREVKIGTTKYKVDALDGKTVYEFYGDFYHGYPFMFPVDSDLKDLVLYKKSKTSKTKPVMDKWKSDLKRNSLLQEHYGLTVYVIWESDWNYFKVAQQKQGELKMYNYEELKQLYKDTFGYEHAEVELGSLEPFMS